MKKFVCAAKTTKEERGFWVLETLKWVFERKDCFFNFKKELGERNWWWVRAKFRIWQQFGEQDGRVQKLWTKTEADIFLSNILNVQKFNLLSITELNNGLDLLVSGTHCWRSAEWKMGHGTEVIFSDYKAKMQIEENLKNGTWKVIFYNCLGFQPHKAEFQPPGPISWRLL